MSYSEFIDRLNLIETQTTKIMYELYLICIKEENHATKTVE